MDKDEQLLLDICKCPNVKLAMQDKNHPCHSVVSVQNNSNEFQVPEPWTGNLDHSKLLIIASNPSIDESEAYPTNDWEDAWIVDFFKNRFDEDYGWTQKGLHVLQKDRINFAERHVPYWAEVRKQASRIYGRDAVAGIDYTLTEVVHCKSRKRKGVKSAAETCSEKWLDRILRISSARVLLILGEDAGGLMQKSLHLNCKIISHGIRVISGKRMWVLFVPAPGSSKARNILDILDSRTLSELNRWINS
jgi:hypothetical protein